MNWQKVFLCSLLLSAMHSSGCDADSRSKSLWFLSSMKIEQHFEDPLMIVLAKAIEEQSLSDIQNLIIQGADINAKGNEGMSPLFWALTKQKAESFKFLLERGANPNVIAEKRVEKKLYPTRPDTQKLALMELAATTDDPIYLALALQHGGDPDTIAYGSITGGITILFRSIAKGGVEHVDLLIDAGSDVNFVNEPYSNSPLEESRAYCRYDIAKRLIEAGADPTIVTGLRVDGKPISFALNIERMGFSEHFSLSQEERLEQRGHYLDVVKYLKNRELLEENFDPWFVENKAKGKTEIITYEDRPEWWPDFPKK